MVLITYTIKCKKIKKEKTQMKLFSKMHYLSSKKKMRLFMLSL